MYSIKKIYLTLILLTWGAPNNASKWQMGFNLAFKGLICFKIKLYYDDSKLCLPPAASTELSTTVRNRNE